MIEGTDLIDAALESGAEFEALYVDRASVGDRQVAALLSRADRAGVSIFSLDAGVFENVADAKSPQPVLAAVRFTVGTLADVGAQGLVLVLDNVRDPGNAGTIIRSADAAGAAAVVLTGDSVDPFNPKTLRASAGSVFHLLLVVAALDETLSHFRALGVRSYATVVHGGTPFRRADLSGPCVVVIGNESSGLDDATVSWCDEKMTIPMAGRAESLNAGVAASLIAFEALSQRSDTTTA